MGDSDDRICCEVVSMFGYDLKKGVVIVSGATMAISAVTLIASMISLKVSQKTLIKMYPVSAANLLFAVYCVGIASYQIIISALLLWKTIMTEGSMFFCNLWYISHLSIIFFYGCFFVARAVTCFVTKHHVDGAFTIIAGILYTGVFFYFCVIVNSYSYTIEDVMFY